jgi:hypothetical protein
MNKDFYVCSEMEKLRKKLDEKNIEWQDCSTYPIEIIKYWICRTQFYYNGQHISVIHGYGSYGGIDFFRDSDEQLLEMMIDGKEPIGYLAAADIFKLIGIK